MTANRFNFRAWAQGKMHTGRIVPAGVDEDGYQWAHDLEARNGIYNAALMQSTGLTDKNGVEIYEGDVVLVDWQDPRYEPQVGIVRWDDSEARFDTAYGSVSEVGWSHEVIGNIYENPELVK